MTPTQRTFTTKAQLNPEAVPTAATTTSQCGKGKTVTPSAKAQSKSQQPRQRTEIQPDADAAEVTQKEKAIQLAKIEDELAKKAKAAKKAHPRRRAPQQAKQGIHEVSHPAAQKDAPCEPVTESSKSSDPVVMVSENGKRPDGASELTEAEQGQGLGQLGDLGRHEEPGNNVVGEEGPEYTEIEPAEGAPEWEGIKPAEEAQIDNDVEMDDINGNSEDEGAFGSGTTPPVKTPGKKLHKASEDKRKTKASNLRKRVQSNRQIMSSGSTFQNSLFDDKSFATPETKKTLTNYVQTWTQGIPAPLAPPAKKQKVSASCSVISVTTSSEPSKAFKSVKSCTVVVEPNNTFPPPPQRSQPHENLQPSHGKKRPVEEPASESDTSEISPPSTKHHQIAELTSDAESDAQHQSSHSSKHSHKGESKLRPTLPLPPRHKTAYTNELSTKSDQIFNGMQSSQTRSRNLPAKHHHTTSRRWMDLADEPAFDSDDEVPPSAPKPRPRNALRTKSYRVDEESNIEEASIPSMLYGGLQDEDDTAEQEAAVASPDRPRAAAKKSKASLKVKSETARNAALPAGARELNRWSRCFLPTVLKYVGGERDKIWTLDERKAMNVFQEIWNVVYSGEEPIGGSKVDHVVGPSIYSLINQRLTEWRNSIGSTALLVVNEFFDSQNFFTTEDRQQAAADLLFCQRYVYNHTEDIVENGEKKIKRRGRYRGGLVIYTVAQHLIETENAINIPGVVEDDEFPKAAIALSATAVHRALELWEKGYITYESYCEAKAKNSKTGGIRKVVGQDGTVKKITNFGRQQCQQWSDQHCNDIWLVEDGKMKLVVADARAAADVILAKNHIIKRKLRGGDEAGPSYQAKRTVQCIESDPES